MACSVTLSGLANPACYKSKGGIVKAWIGVSGAFQPTVTSGSIVSGTVTGFKPYEFRKNSGSMTSTLNVDQANGVNYVSTELQLVFGKMETQKRIEVAALAIGDLEVIVKDSNGKYWFLGYDQPVNATAGTGETGTASTDGNRYTITLTDESDEFPYEITSADLIASIEALG